MNLPSYGWLSPDGNLWECGYEDHSDAVWDIIEEYYKTQCNPLTISPTKFIKTRNWLHVSPEDFGSFDGMHPTPKQMLWFDEWLAERPNRLKQFVDKCAVLSGQIHQSDVDGYRNWMD